MAVIYQPPSFIQFQLEKGFKILRPDISNPPLIIIAVVEGVQNIMAVIIEPPSISNWKGGSKYHGHDTMTHCYGTQEVKKRL